jgi:hypothetical protein
MLLLGTLAAACLGMGLLLLDGEPERRGDGPQGQASSAPSPTLEASPQPTVELAVGPEARPDEAVETQRDASTGVASKAPAGARRAAARAEPLPLQSDGTIDFAALGLTGKEAGADLLRSEEPERRARVDYGFRLGDAWVVETYYRNMQTGTGESWSDAVYWHFEVVAEDAFQGQEALVVRASLRDAQGTDEAGYTPATLYVSRQDYRLLGAELTEVRGGKQKQATVTYDRSEGASHAVGSIVPFDLPPRGVEGRVTRGSGLPSLEPADARSRARFPGPGTLLGAGQDYVEVEFTTDGTTVRQRWSLTDMRWPTETVTEHWRSYRRKLS